MALRVPLRVLLRVPSVPVRHFSASLRYAAPDDPKTRSSASPPPRAKPHREVRTGDDLQDIRPRLPEIGQLQPSVSRPRALKRPAGVPKMVQQIKADQAQKQQEQKKNVLPSVREKALEMQQAMLARPETRAKRLNLWGITRGAGKDKTKRKSLWQSFTSLPVETRLVFLGCVICTLLFGICWMEQVRSRLTF